MATNPNGHGGARNGAGRSIKPKAAAAPNELAGLFQDVSSERIRRLDEALWERACGYSLMVAQKRAGARGAGETLEEIEVVAEPDVCPHCEQPMPGSPVQRRYVYLIQPDPRAQELILSHGIGRPAVKEITPARPVFILRHNIPTWKDARYEKDAVPAAIEDTDAVPPRDV